MPFSSLTNPDSLARANCLLEMAWSEVEQRGQTADDAGRARTRLAYLIAGHFRDAVDDQEFVDFIVQRFLEG
jgi:hypothetical protein